MPVRALSALSIMALCLGAPRPVAAQQSDAWEFSLVPLYFWAMELDGHLTAGPATVPIFLEFADAADNLGGAFSFHFEASKGRWGVLTDLNFIQLSSSAPFTVGGLTIERGFELDNIMFELGGSYLVNPNAGLGVVGGLRTYTLSPKIGFGTDSAGVTPIDTSETSANAFVGVVLRPRISEKWTFIGRADVGAGGADFTWSALAGIEYRFKSWGGLEAGYKALGIDVTGGDQELREYDVTHYGPIFGLRFHWGG